MPQAGPIIIISQSRAIFFLILRWLYWVHIYKSKLSLMLLKGFSSSSKVFWTGHWRSSKTHESKFRSSYMKPLFCTHLCWFQFHHLNFFSKLQLHFLPIFQVWANCKERGREGCILKTLILHKDLLWNPFVKQPEKASWYE